jgi:hypothetical protein
VLIDGEEITKFAGHPEELGRPFLKGKAGPISFEIFA